MFAEKVGILLVGLPCIEGYYSGYLAINKTPFAGDEPLNVLWNMDRFSDFIPNLPHDFCVPPSTIEFSSKEDSGVNDCRIVDHTLAWEIALPTRGPMLQGP